MVEDLRARRVGVLVAAILIFTITAVFNSGFIAVDDYASNIEVVVPAQRHPFGDIVA
ncbi:MAG: hypothetical protein HYR96_01705 [Deltaproteobacteria bacterium]|nr:hypothetical protein [Deltaproteobacteria bacterium]